MYNWPEVAQTPVSCSLRGVFLVALLPHLSPSNRPSKLQQLRKEHPILPIKSTGMLGDSYVPFLSGFELPQTNSVHVIRGKEIPMQGCARAGERVGCMSYEVGWYVVLPSTPLWLQYLPP
jgi:hypothetical protein